MSKKDDQNAVTPPANQSGDEGQPNDDNLDTNDDSADASDGGTPSNDDKKFTQADLDRAAAKARRDEKQKRETADKEKQGEFQTLYQTEKDKASALELKLVSRDICDELEIPREWRDSVVGDDEDSIRESATTLKARLDKMVQDALESHKSLKPGTPPPSPNSDKSDADKEKEGRDRTRKNVMAAMGFKVAD